MIIWGWKGCEWQVGAGEFHCPDCRERCGYKRMRVATYFTLYFIPLFQTEDHGDYVQCLRCGQQHRPSVLTYEPPTPEQLLAQALAQDLDGGLPFHMAAKKLVAEHGMSQEQATAWVEQVAGQPRECPACRFRYGASVRSCTNCGAALPPPPGGEPNPFADLI